MTKGKYETELEAIVTGDEWAITSLASLRVAVDAIASTMKNIAAWPGWTGVSADSATDAFFAIARQVEAISATIDDNSTKITAANQARLDARSDYLALPEATVPGWVHAAAMGVGSLAIPIPPLGLVAGNEAVQLFENYLGSQRETAAQKSLGVLQTTLHGNLPAPVKYGGYVSATMKTDDSTTTGGGGAGGGVPATPRHSAVTGSGGSHTGSGLVSGPNTGTDPGFLAIDGGGGVSGSGSVGGGLGSDGVGGGGIAGAGTAGLAAGAAGLAALRAASRIGGGMGGVGSSAQLGSGGLLGSSGKAAAAAAGAEESASGTGARPGTSMMGQPGGAGSSNKQKRAGLGGFIAPKLEDDEERGPRSAAALAGSRDSAPQD